MTVAARTPDAPKPPQPAPADRAGGSAAVAEALRSAEALPLQSGLKWTPPRRRVYELLLISGRPTKAYDLVDHYSSARTAHAPTVYWALEFLEANGFVHRIASLNAFMACRRPGGAKAAAAFLICRSCGGAEEFEPTTVWANAYAKQMGFEVGKVTLEIQGRCRACR